MDEQQFGQCSTEPFNAVWSNVTPGMHRLTAVGTDSSGSQWPSPPVSITVARTLITTGSVWKYLDDGTDQGTAWYAPEFDDRAWRTGPAELGYGDSENGRPEATVVSYGPDPSNKYVTTYFRREFVVTNTASYSYLLLRVLYDDGAVVYVNGSEAARLSMPYGPVNYLTLAFEEYGDGTFFYEATAPASLLREGTNVLAVEIHQCTRTSSDISFELEMLALPIITRNQSPVVSLTSPVNNGYYFHPAAIPLTAEASDLDGTVTNVEFYVGSLRLGRASIGVSPTSYRFGWTDAVPGIYTVTAVATDNEGARRVSAPVTFAVYEGTSQWVAYNDHYAGPNTHSNATAWNVFGTAGGAPGDEGLLQNIAAGASLPARLEIFELGATGSPEFGAPPPATPAYDAFNGYVDFGSGGVDHAIVLDRHSLMIHHFTGLDPLKRYRFRGTAVSGVPEYTNRWTLFTLMDAEAFTGAHTPNVLTPDTAPGVLDADQAAMNTGDNSTGDVVGWDNIAPGPDGTFAIVSEQYLGPAPGNDVPGPYAYGLVAVRLEEMSGTPFVQITSPEQDAGFEGFTDLKVTATASAVHGITNVLFFANTTLIGSDATNPYSIVWSNADFGEFGLTAVAFDARGLVATSAVVNIRINPPPPNTNAPVIFSLQPPAGGIITNLSTAQVTFSEPVYHVDAADLLVNGVPALGLSGSGSNYTFIVSQPPYGLVPITWAAGHGITDRGWPTSLPFDENGPGATWIYELIDRTSPFVSAKDPPAGSLVKELTQVTVTFS